MTPNRLLIVDDEATLRDLIRRYLERAGYSVETCGTSAEAIEKFAPGRFELVITDLTLGGMNGEELLRRMREIDPPVRGIIASGYPYEPQLAGVAFLQKPFLPKMLAEAVERALGG